jgi:hypothetical protein
MILSNHRSSNKCNIVQNSISTFLLHRRWYNILEICNESLSLISDRPVVFSGYSGLVYILTVSGPKWVKVMIMVFNAWIYIYLCNQCITPLNCEFESRSWRGACDTTLWDKVCQWLATSRWFSPGNLVSWMILSNHRSSNKCNIVQNSISTFLLHRRWYNILEEGGTVAQETRLYDSVKHETRSMRSKEEAKFHL